MLDFTYALFAIDVVILLILLTGATWSVAFPDRRIWPPPYKLSWQHSLTWACFYVVFGINIALVFLDWNSWIFKSNLRFIIGIPVALLGGLLAAWGVVALGVKNSSGLKGGFVSSGPYRFTRNPQYVGDIICPRDRLRLAPRPGLLWAGRGLPGSATREKLGPGWVLV